MGVAVCDIVGAIVFASIVLILPQGLFQGGDSGEVLRVQGHIVHPTGAAIGGVAAVHGGHGEGNEEGSSCVNDHLRNPGFHHQVQAQGQAVGGGVAVSVGQGQGRAATHLHIVLQRILDRGGVGSQGGAEGVNEHIGLIIVMIVIQLVGVVRIFIPACSIRQADSGQQISPNCLVNAVQHLYMVGCSAIGGGLGELTNVGYPQVAEFYPTNGIAIGGVAITQIAGIVGIAGPDGVTQGVVDRLGIHASRDIRTVPHAILGGVGEIILVNIKRAGAGGVNGSILCPGSGDSDRETQQKRQTHGQHQAEGNGLFPIFHEYILLCYRLILS